MVNKYSLSKIRNSCAVYVSGPAVLHIRYKQCHAVIWRLMQTESLVRTTVTLLCLGHKAALASVLSSQRANVLCAKGLIKEK